MNPAITLPLTALDGEQALLQARSRYLLTTPTGWGYNPINGDLFLSEQRLVFKPDPAVTSVQRIALGAAGAAPVWFPLRRIVACSEQPMKVQWGKPNVLKLEFDNGGREYFVIHPTKTMPFGTWAAALLNAKAHAPELPYDRVPALKSGFEQPANSGAKRLMMYWGFAVVALCMVCSVLALIVNMVGK